MEGNKNVTVNLLFYGMHSKSLSGHYDEDMLWITLKGIRKWLFYNAHGFWHIGYEISCKVAANRLDPFVVIKKQKLYPYSAHIGVNG